MFGTAFWSTISFVMTSFFLPFTLGTSNMMSSRIFSTMARRPRAPVLLFMAMSAISSIASSEKVRSTSSIAKLALNCLVIAFFGSVRMRFKSSRVSSLSATVIGRRPISSGIMPNLTRSSEVTWFKRFMRSSSFRCVPVAPKPIDVAERRCSIIFSRPTNAPPQMKRMFVVSMSIIS